MRKRRVIVFICIFVGFVFLLAVLFPFLFLWSEINCRHEDINIKTGQVRYSRYVCFVCVSERIEDTPISLVLEGERVDVAEIKEWHHANTFTPGVSNSPHYYFHGALYQANMVGNYLRNPWWSEEQKREFARGVLEAWQRSGRDEGAQEFMQMYIEDLMDE